MHSGPLWLAWCSFLYGRWLFISLLCLHICPDVYIHGTFFVLPCQNKLFSLLCALRAIIHTSIETHILCDNLILFNFIYLFLERGREKEDRERNSSVWLPLACHLLGSWPTTQASALDWESNRLPCDLQAGMQSTEPHQPGLWYFIFWLPSPPHGSFEFFENRDNDLSMFTSLIYNAISCT